MKKDRLEEACKNYDPDKDYTGAIGRKLAELKRHRQGFPSAFADKSSIKEIIKHTPKDIGGNPHVNSLVKKDLVKLKKAGYSVNLEYFQSQDNVGKWNYYLKVLSDNGYFK